MVRAAQFNDVEGSLGRSRVPGPPWLGLVASVRRGRGAVCRGPIAKTGLTLGKYQRLRAIWFDRATAQRFYTGWLKRPMAASINIF